MTWPFDAVAAAWERSRAIAESAAAQSPPPDVAPPSAPALEAFAGPLEQLPRNRTEVYRTFGDPGVGSADPAWERRSMVVAKDLPGRWNSGKGRLYVHRLAEPYLREALRRCELAGVLGYIERLGCFNFRHQRHDPSRPLSYHSWGIAVDINAADNRPVTNPPKPWSMAWVERWPRGVPFELVEAFESVGWSWGGRWGWADPMHMELVRS